MVIVSELPDAVESDSSLLYSIDGQMSMARSNNVLRIREAGTLDTQYLVASKWSSSC